MGCPSNSNWCVLNVIWQTGYWICITVAIFAAQIMMETEKDFLQTHDYHKLLFALIVIGFCFDCIVVFVEFAMVTEKLEVEDEDAEPELLYCVKLWCVILSSWWILLTTFLSRGAPSPSERSGFDGEPLFLFYLRFSDVSVLVYWIVFRLILSSIMCCITKKIMDDVDRRVNSKNVVGLKMVITLVGPNNVWGNTRSSRSHSNGERKSIVICFILNYCVKVCKMK